MDIYACLIVEEDGSVFVDMEHSYCLPRSNSQESVDDTLSIPNRLDHDYASSPMSPPPKPPSLKTPLKDRNRIVDRHKVKKDFDKKYATSAVVIKVN